MKKSIHLLLIASMLILQFDVEAQVSSIPFTAAIDSFPVISGTVLDQQGADDQFYTNIPIGFTFDFAGSQHTNMVVSCNGYIQLDTLGTMMFTNILGGTFNNRIAAFGSDLKHWNPTASLQYATMGTAPNRVCIIQWLHYSYFGATGSDVSFQIRLHESSNCISLVYGNNIYASNPMQTQIGLRGSNNTDFIVLGDSTCNWANAYPYPNITTQFPISTSCSMPSGFAFYFGPCGHNSGVSLGYISGTVFSDLNGNGIKDTGEPPIKQHIMDMDPGNYYAATDGNGDYAFFFSDSTLTYTVNANSITYWASTTPQTVSINPQTQACSPVDFGFQMIPGIHEVGIHCPAWPVRPAMSANVPIVYYNNGTSVENDTIVMELDSLYSFVSSNPAPLSVIGQTITWTYSNLAPGQSGQIQLVLMPDSTAVMGNYLNSTLSIGPSYDTVPANNVLIVHQLITNSWDPNDKRVYPEGVITAGTELNYTIRFQNTGNAPAINVVVKDTLENTLDITTMHITGFSHPMNFSMDGNGIATFTFFNIMLPDSGSDNAGSNGFVSFRIRTKDNLAPGTLINNRAGIIFDNNPPIITNFATDSIDIILNANPIVSVNTFMVYPNPSSGSVIFRFSEDMSETGNVSIYATNGQLVFSKLAIRNSDPINLAELSQGLYTVVINTEYGKRAVRFVKQ